jgi:hypothetical protein
MARGQRCLSPGLARFYNTGWSLYNTGLCHLYQKPGSTWWHRLSPVKRNYLLSDFAAASAAS